MTRDTRRIPLDAQDRHVLTVALMVAIEKISTTQDPSDGSLKLSIYLPKMRSLLDKLSQ